MTERSRWGPDIDATTRGAGRAVLALIGVMVQVGSLLVGSGLAHGYRPFDFTDADVAAAGELELELGPLHVLRPGAGRNVLVAPAVILNFGLLPRLELVLEGQHLYESDAGGRGAGSRLVDNAVLLKGLARDGSLQGGSGASVALEAGMLLPTVNDEPGIGMEGLAVVSLGGAAGMAHLNGVAAWSRAHEVELGGGLILEGPESWRIRPVAEGLYERTLGGGALTSGLVGAIWEPTEALSFDAAGRVFVEGGVRGFEVRLGLTWKMQIWNRRGAR
jgi:hypothetical protein